MSNTKSKKTKSKTGLARCMELASDRKGLIFVCDRVYIQVRNKK